MGASGRAGFLAAALGLWSALFAASVQARETIRLTAVGGYAPSASWVHVFYDNFFPEVDRLLARSGRYRIEWIRVFSGTVAKPGGVLDALRHNLGDVGIVVTPFHPDKVPFFSLTYVTPFVSTDLGLIARTISDLVARYPAISDAFGDYDQVYLTTVGPIDNYQIAMVEKFETLADYRGRKIAGIGPNLRYLDGLGAIGVSSYLSNYYNILDSGMVDGVIMWAEAAANLKFYEVAPYLIDARIGGITSIVVNVNRRTWQRLPGEVRDALLGGAIHYREELASYVMAASVRGARDFEAGGGTVVTLSEEDRRTWANNMPNLAIEWVAEMDRRGLPGRRMVSEYMDVMRAHNQPIVRHWDREIPG